MKRNQTHPVAGILLAAFCLIVASPTWAQEAPYRKALERQARINEAIERVLPAYTCGLEAAPCHPCSCCG